MLISTVRRNLFAKITTLIFSSAGLALGVFLLVTFAISIFAIVQRNHVTVGLVVLNYALIVDAIVVVVLGTRVWYFTLRERDNFFKIYQRQSEDTIRFIQNKVSTFIPVPRC